MKSDEYEAYYKMNENLRKLTAEVKYIQFMLRLYIGGLGLFVAVCFGLVLK